MNNSIKCSKCGNLIKPNEKFCRICGNAISNNTSVVIEKKIVKPTDFDGIYYFDGDKLLREFINRELVKANIDVNTNMMPMNVLKRKKILSIIYSVLLFVFICLIFFHFPLYTYIIGIILLFLFNRLTKKYDLMGYLIKEVKARPGEKISNIVMNTKNTFVDSNIKPFKIIGTLVAIVLPLIIFIKPRIMYEKMDNGYGVRFYAFGITNFRTAVIPETYKGEKVISLRGNTFSNMPFLYEVKLPDSVTEIRGQAFKNCVSLVKVNIPINLEYLGGGAFYNAKSIEKIELPDTLTYLGGESFYGAYSLKEVKLSNNITEIRGDSFENCVSLKSITIPDNVTRIGGHAFYGDYSLSEVIIGKNSKLMEIGSSAFRRCDSLYSITIPATTYVNERAFKESPTNVLYFQKY